MHQHGTTTVLSTSGRMGRRVVKLTNIPTEIHREDKDIRHDLVARIRAEIAAGTYDTPEKFQSAFERMIDDVE